MPIKVHQTTACSHGELSGVAGNASRPEQSIKEIVKDALTTAHYSHQPDGTLFSFYVFSAAVYPVNSPMGPVATNYGDNLAGYIKAQGLGDVVETPAMTNIAYHKDHANKVYVWVVDHKAVAKWYRENVVEKEQKDWFVMKSEDFNDEIDWDNEPEDKDDEPQEAWF